MNFSQKDQIRDQASQLDLVFSAPADCWLATQSHPEFPSPWLPGSQVWLSDRARTKEMHRQVIGGAPERFKRDSLGRHVHLRPFVFLSSSSLAVGHEAQRYSILGPWDNKQMLEDKRIFCSSLYCYVNVRIRHKNIGGEFLLGLCCIYKSIWGETNIFWPTGIFHLGHISSVI